MADSSKQRVGFIGVGTMGRGMVKNLLKAGFEVTIYARNPEKVQDVISAGAKLADSSKAVAEQTDVIITIVPNSPQVEEVILGRNGVLEGATGGKIIVDMSTINPETSRKVAAACAAKGVAFLDAPVSGGSVGAENGTLTIMAGGDEAVFQQVVPVFQAMGREEAIIHVGPVGAGETVKIINNMLGAISAAAASQALVMGLKAGVEPEIVEKIVGMSSGANWQLNSAFPRLVFSGSFKPGFFTELMHKDIGLAIQLGKDSGVELTIAEVTEPIYRAAIEAGYGRDDYTSIIRPIEQAAGVEVRSKKA
ncbi:MAG TPA: NAD(P)-dependent oxidoreductase [Chloroflexia bacterium]|nr:NAD(P)-dependent oxidoreductase [Chloroflexia bacterium]